MALSLRDVRRIVAAGGFQYEESSSVIRITGRGWGAELACVNAAVPTLAAFRQENKPIRRQRLLLRWIDKLISLHGAGALWREIKLTTASLQPGEPSVARIDRAGGSKKTDTSAGPEAEDVIGGAGLENGVSEESDSGEVHGIRDRDVVTADASKPDSSESDWDAVESDTPAWRIRATPQELRRRNMGIFHAAVESQPGLCTAIPDQAGLTRELCRLLTEIAQRNREPVPASNAEREKKDAHRLARELVGKSFRLARSRKTVEGDESPSPQEKAGTLRVLAFVDCSPSRKRDWLAASLVVNEAAGLCCDLAVVREERISNGEWHARQWLGAGDEPADVVIYIGDVDGVLVDDPQTRDRTSPWIIQIMLPDRRPAEFSRVPNERHKLIDRLEEKWLTR